jgi:hypothetical protein
MQNFRIRGGMRELDIFSRILQGRFNASFLFCDVLSLRREVRSVSYLATRDGSFISTRQEERCGFL